MSTTTFPHAAATQASSHASHGVGEFPVAWFQATPAYLVLRPVGTFVADWFQATPVGIALRTLFR